MDSGIFSNPSAQNSSAQNSGLFSRLSKAQLLLLAALGISAAAAPMVYVSVRPMLAETCKDEVEVCLYRKASPAVATIETETGSGSGAILTAEGLVITNAHVVEDAKEVQVAIPDETGGRVVVRGEVIAYGEEGLDLAAVQLQGSGFEHLALEEESISVGQKVYAIGTPFGAFQNSLTQGIVSRLDPVEKLIQTDAAINPGNSGGPLLNAEGDIVGINTAIYASRDGGNIGIGFAIPAEVVQEFLAAVEDGTAPTEPQITGPVPGIYNDPTVLAMNGNFIQSELTEDSNVLDDLSYFNTYVFEGQAGQQVEIAMESAEIDSYLMLFDPNGEPVAEDDDSNGNGNAYITVTLPADGVYTIFANSYEAGEVGSYAIGGLLSN